MSRLPFGPPSTEVEVHGDGISSYLPYTGHFGSFSRMRDSRSPRDAGRIEFITRAGSRFDARKLRAAIAALGFKPGKLTIGRVGGDMPKPRPAGKEGDPPNLR